MAKSELSLLENATDSLNEALLKYEEGNAGVLKAFKFSVLHFAHFIELLLKFYVAEAHPLLIYKNPFSKNLAKENTIGLWEAVQFLKNEGHEISKEFETDLRWLKSLRNDIEHHRFSLDIDEAKPMLGRLMQTVNEINNAAGNFELKRHVDEGLLKTFDVLADEYKAAVAKAVEEAEQVGGAENGYFCSSCGHAGTISYCEGIYRCHFCGDESEGVECCVCGDQIPATEGEVWNDDHPLTVDYICHGCLERISDM